ncbi:hypothetical protein Tco_0334788 [Tanacetum coccineum]
MTPRSCLKWKPTGRIFKNVVLRWVLTGKTFASSTTKVESETPNGSNANITNQRESEQAFDVSAGTLLSTGTSFNPIKEGLRMTFDHNRSSLGLHNKTFEQSSSSLGRQWQMVSAENNTSGPVPQ